MRRVGDRGDGSQAAAGLKVSSNIGWIYTLATLKPCAASLQIAYVGKNVVSLPCLGCMSVWSARVMRNTEEWIVRV